MSDPDVEDWEVWKGDIPFWKHSIAGSCAGIMEHSCFFPLDTIKTCLQTGKIGGIFGSNGLYSYLKLNGFNSLFNGFSAAVLGNIPAHASLFTTYEASKKIMEKIGTKSIQKEGKNSRFGAVRSKIYDYLVSPTICGGISTISHDIISTPIDVVKQRLQLGSYSGIRSCIFTILKEEGVNPFFRSLPITLFMNIPQTGLFVLINENLKLLFKDVKKDSLRGKSFNFVLAGLSGGLAGFLTNPLDLIKTRLQTQTCYTSRLGSNTVLYPTVRKTVMDICKKNGIKGMYKGALFRALLIAPSYAICWGTYETVKNALSDKSKRS
ncbi:mitochondrial carrier protein [Cryptosporidium ryanae]|uniref:mitochondrial carrier protein n=1 Tax=Cryptosporidium ryanae TaxID=515981 RepID=UPI00351A68F2|nr:mitochondrial carrier protein [Cryptosporidium ryanae]